MGLLKLLTKPMCYRLRLQRDIPLRLLAVLAGGAAFTGILLFIFEQFRPEIEPVAPPDRAPVGPSVPFPPKVSPAQAPSKSNASPSPAVSKSPSELAGLPLAFPQSPAAKSSPAFSPVRTDPPATSAPVQPQIENLRRTELAGGVGGFPLELISPEKKPVIGLRYRLGNWSGKPRVGRLEPLFVRGDAERGWERQFAREGYALGALKVSGSEFVNAVAAVFYRIRDDGTLDVNDSFAGEWVGVPEHTAVLVNGDGWRVIGLYGRGGAVLDAVGLVLD